MESQRKLRSDQRLGSPPLKQPITVLDIARLAIDRAAQSNAEQNGKLHRQNEKTSRREQWTCGRLRMALEYL